MVVAAWGLNKGKKRIKRKSGDFVLCSHHYFVSLQHQMKNQEK
jgi:hypothetical protein